MALSEPRRLAARLLHRRDDSDPSVAWRRLPRDLRDTVVELAGGGRPHPDPSVRQVAMAWATAVIAVPLVWAWSRGVLTYVVPGLASGVGVMFLLHHDPLPFAIGWVAGGAVGRSIQLMLVRSRARRVLRANMSAAAPRTPLVVAP